ncbi:MAG: TIR domain-containing protein [Clostridia bacterium]|nr:TIR domain-containing protein [Clostridia bacterium]
MSRLFQPYEGKRPFVFVSYAHLNSETVVDTIRNMHDKRYRVWYDEGIPGGSDWPANVATHVRDCGAMLFFSSWRSLASPNCFSEVRTAVRLGKPLVVIPLDDTEPDSAWEELLKQGEKIQGKKIPKEMATEILAGRTIGREFRESWFENIPWRVVGLIFSVLFLLAAAVFVRKLIIDRLSELENPTVNMTPTPTPGVTPTPTPAPTVSVPPGAFVVSFPDTLQERAVRKELGMPEGDIRQWNLAEITELYFFGNMTVGSSDIDSYKVTFDSNGICCVNGGKVGYFTGEGKKAGGMVSDLRLFPNMVRLRRLALVWQPLEVQTETGGRTVTTSTLSNLNGLTLLEELDLSGSTVSDLSVLTDLPSLSVIRLEHTDVADLRPLGRLSALKTVTVSKDMLPLIWDDAAAYTVILTDR